MQLEPASMFAIVNVFMYVKYVGEPSSHACTCVVGARGSNSSRRVLLTANQATQISDGDQMIWENTGSFTKECQVSEEIQSYSSVKVADVSPKVQSSSASDLKSSNVAEIVESQNVDNTASVSENWLRVTTWTHSQGMTCSFIVKAVL
ncbi:hypothetical protein ACE6H2_019822 [Prunus campanulata]